MITRKSIRTKAFVLLGILATTGGTMARLPPPHFVTFIDDSHTGCQLPFGSPCSPIWFLENQGTTITIHAICEYDLATHQYAGEDISAFVVSAGPGHCCTAISNDYPKPQCAPSATPPGS